MASKGKDRSGFLTKEPTINTTNEYPGALNPNYYVWALNKQGQKKKGSILSIRKNKKGREVNPNPNEFDYTYYIHWEGVKRRMDDWVHPTNIEMTNEFIDKNKKKKKKTSDKPTSSDEEHEGLDEQSRIAHEEATKVKTISHIEFGKYISDTWYYSPYPEPYHNLECLYICEFCLSFFCEKEEIAVHLQEYCSIVHPPGDQIYVDNEKKISFWEIDGAKNPTYCENLSYMAKLFLDHKLLLYSIDPFMFYVMTEFDEFGHHVVGYFSKNKDFADGLNLSCILCLPFHQRKGYGKLMIHMSYMFSKIETRYGSPERPLSDLGRKTYTSYWMHMIIDFIRLRQKNQGKEQGKEGFCIDDIQKDTGIKDIDIVDTMERYNMIKKHQGQVYICTDPKMMDEIYAAQGRPVIDIDMDQLHWSPYIFKNIQQ